MNEQTPTAAKAVFETMRHAAQYWVPFYDTLTVGDVAALIVDSSEWASWGFDAIETDPTPWWRFWARQTGRSVVLFNCV